MLSLGLHQDDGGDEANGEGNIKEPKEFKDKAEFSQLVELFRPYTRYPHKAPMLLRKNRELVLRVLRDHKDGWRLLRYTDAELQNDRDLMLAALRGRGADEAWRAMKSAPAELRADKGVIEQVVKYGGLVGFECASAPLRKDPEFMFQALVAEHAAYQATNNANRAIDEPHSTSRISESYVSTMLEKFMKLDEKAKKLSDEKKALLVQEITQEVREGECALDTDEHGHLRRVLVVAVLRMTRSDGFILAQVGKMGRSSWKAGCALPGNKFSNRLEPKEGLQKLILKKFGWNFWKMVETGITTSHVDQEDGVSESKVLPVRYMRCIFCSEMSKDNDWLRHFIKVPNDRETLTMRGSSDTRCTGSARKRFISRLAGATVHSPLRGHLAPEIYRYNERGLAELENQSAECYAWMPMWEFEWLMQPEGKKVLQLWLDDLQVPQGAVVRSVTTNNLTGGADHKLRHKSPA